MKNYRNRLTALLLLSFFFWIAAGCTTTLIKNDPAIMRGQLDNRMQYYILENNEPQNRIFLTLAVKAGSLLEEEDQQGIAHLVEHMAFNGTEHFAANDLIKYLESTGMRFGADVNAYTNFDETVYTLEIPADDPAILEQAVLVLHDWACALTFDPVELDKERGVVIEEWRAGRTVEGRRTDVRIPFLYAGSRYAERLPIGDPDIVKTIPHERVIDFYQTWYRPELMAVIITGKVNTAQVQGLIKEKLGIIATTASLPQRPQYAIPLSAEKSVKVFTDAEEPVTTIELTQSRQREKLTTEAAYRRSLIRTIIFHALSSRLQEKSQEPKAPFIQAYCGSYPLNADTENIYLSMTAHPNAFNESLTVLFEELDRIHQFGISESEYERTKAVILTSAQHAWDNRDKRHSSGLTHKMMRSFLTGDAVPSASDEYTLITRHIKTITLQDLHTEARTILSSGSMKLFVSGNTAAKDIPSEKALLSWWTNRKPNTALTSYQDSDVTRPLFEASGTKGKIESIQTIAPQGIKALTLSNNAKVIYYPTAFKTNEIKVFAFSRGGLSLIADSDYPSASAAVPYAITSGLNGFSAADINKKVAGKHISLTPLLSDNYAGISAFSSVADLETMMQVLNLYFTKPYFTKEGWMTLMEKYRTAAQALEKDIPSQFQAFQSKLLYGSSIRHGILTKDFIAKMDQAKAEAVYRSVFRNAADFTFVVVGSIDENVLHKLAETYIGSLPSDTQQSTAHKQLFGDSPFPTGIIKDALALGSEPKSSVVLTFGGTFTPNHTSMALEEELLNQCLSILETYLRETIREALSGSYHVSVYNETSFLPKPRFHITIAFNCEPERKKELTDAVFAQIKRLQHEPISQDVIAKTKESWLRSQETALKDNNTWISLMVYALLTDTPFTALDMTQEVAANITAPVMQRIAQQYMNTGNYVHAELNPKK